MKQSTLFLFVLGLLSSWRIARLFACESSPYRLTEEQGTILASHHQQTPTLCIWQINVPKGNRIELTVRAFDIKTSCCSCTEDFVEFRDGLNSSARLLGRYCTKTHPDRIYSSGNTLWVKFFNWAPQEERNMSSVNKFRAEYRTICGVSVRGSAGEISSPGYPSFSNSTKRCLYTVVVPYGWVKITFKDFHVGKKSPHVYSGHCESDFVLVKEMSFVELKGSTQGQTLCGRLSSPYLFSTEGRELSLLYESTTASRFSARFEAIETNNLAPCGGTLTADAGYIYSPGYPNQYFGNRVCTWKIEVTHGQYVELTYVVFNFSEASRTCANGHVDIFDGWGTNAKKIRRNCGFIENLPRITSRDNRLLVRAWATNHSRTGIFLFRYRVTSRGLCHFDKFTCTSRECVLSIEVCNGVKDCMDGSDELNCPSKKKTKVLYVLWVVIVLIATTLVVFWLWRTWKKAVRHTMVMQRDRRFTWTHGQDYSYEVPSQSGAPPTYSEAIQQEARSNLPTYEDAVRKDGADDGTVLLQRSDHVRFTNNPDCFGGNLSSSNHLTGMERTQVNLTPRPTDQTFV